MGNQFWLRGTQKARLKPYCPQTSGKLRAEDRHILYGRININVKYLRWCAPRECDPHKFLYCRSKHWIEKGVFAQIFVGLAADDAGKNAAIAANCLKSHRTAWSPQLKRRSVEASSGALRAA